MWSSCIILAPFLKRVYNLWKKQLSFFLVENNNVIFKFFTVVKNKKRWVVSRFNMLFIFTFVFVLWRSNQHKAEPFTTEKKYSYALVKLSPEGRIYYNFKFNKGFLGENIFTTSHFLFLFFVAMSGHPFRTKSFSFFFRS